MSHGFKFCSEADPRVMGYKIFTGRISIWTYIIMHHSNSLAEAFLKLTVSKQALGNTQGEMTLGQIFLWPFINGLMQYNRKIGRLSDSQRKYGFRRLGNAGFTF